MIPVRHLLIVITLYLALIAVPSLAQQSWSTRSGFSLSTNPSGAWSFGYIDDSGTFALYDTRFEPGHGIVGWCTDHDPDTCGNITMNPTADAVAAFGMRWEPGQIIVHPGYGNYKAVIRWVCPLSVRIRLTAGFSGQALGGNPAKVHVYVNGTRVFLGGTRGFVGSGPNRLSRMGDHPEESYIGAVTLSRGTTVDLVVSGDGSDFPGPAGVDVLATVTQVIGESNGDQPLPPDYTPRPFPGVSEPDWYSQAFKLSDMPFGHELLTDVINRSAAKG